MRGLDRPKNSNASTAGTEKEKGSPKVPEKKKRERGGTAKLGEERDSED